MKLNYKRTVLIGFAFFLISAFWQAYNTIIPLILTNRFHMSQTLSGFIMSLDNVLAVFMLPLFGALSDRIHTPLGRRTPFLLVGTLCASALTAVIGRVPVLPLFLLVLLLLLVSMATFRSAAVALMPDITPKPLRSRGNAVINLMGTFGGMAALGLGIVFHTGESGRQDFSAYLLAIALLMLAALLLYLLTVRERRWADEAAALCPESEEDTSEAQPRATGHASLSRAERTSLFLLLASVALWYVGYNSVTSKYSVYADEVLGIPYHLTLLLAQIAATLAFLPVGALSARLGRRRCVLAGVVMLTGAFTAAAFVTPATPAPLMYALFCLAGIGWATINVNSFPMVVELSRSSDVGRYTGYYYTASMAAQVITPILAGSLYDWLGWWVFFPYAAVFCALSFVTMLFVRHGDVRPAPPASLLESFCDGDSVD